MKLSGLSVFLALIIQLAPLQSQSNSPSFLSSETSYIGDQVTNFSGGKRIGTVYLGLLNWKLDLKTSDLFGKDYGAFRINIANSHGGTPSADFVGDFQGVSNIEAGTHTFIYELYYQQNFGALTIVAGLQDLNASFLCNECAALFLNSSFGIPSTISTNFSAPIYPLTALGIVAQLKINEGLTGKLGLFDGAPDDFNHSEYNMNWKLSRNDGYLLIGELESAAQCTAGMQGFWKIGGYIHESKTLAESNPQAPLQNFGVYALFSAPIYRSAQGGNGLSVFSQVSFSPDRNTINTSFYSLGLHYKGLLPGRSEDIAGIAAARADLRNSLSGEETALEFTYLATVNDHLYIKPDVQIIVHPAGEDYQLRDAIVGSLQFGLTF